MKSYELSTVTLRAILAHPSLQREKVDETMEAMASANADAKDIDEAIRIGFDVAQTEPGIDDADLEAELAALVKEVTDEKTAKMEARTEKEKQAKLVADKLKAPSHVPVAAEEVEEGDTSVVSEEAA